MLANIGINWATPLLILAIYGVVRYFKSPKVTQKDSVNWTPLETVGITLAIYFGSQLIGLLLIYVFGLIGGLSQTQDNNWLNNNVYGQFVMVFAVEALTLSLLLGFLKKRSANLKTIGLGTPKIKDIGFVLIGFLFYFVTYLLVLAVLQRAVPNLNKDQKQMIGFSGARRGQLGLVFISLVILPPFIEELMMRGFLYSGLKKGLPIMWAAIITSLLFGLAHLEAGSGQPLLWTAGIDTFILSFVLIYLREKTGTLWASIGLHMLKNCIAFASLFVFHIV